ncbi:hypothetical protein DFP72DRAFT_1046979 [Ephemerocybe angulata]|uniref:Uncharacterized protein n=1 Tax=Ephemerocybe angulata TaxID=980116 RepID=A0A8H6M4I0_9AGAR|nr:hypothetical protein DFP72DRAFT_1046979 [Tulosesus angulatus]
MTFYKFARRQTELWPSVDEEPTQGAQLGEGHQRLEDRQKQHTKYTTPQGPLPPSKPNHEFTRKPSGTLARYVWKWRMWFEATFVLSMLEPWEKIMLVTIFLVVSFFFTSAIIKYLPKHLTIMKRRATYYLIGQEGDERLLWQWISGLLPIVANAPAASEAASTARRLSTNSEL